MAAAYHQRLWNGPAHQQDCAVSQGSPPAVPHRGATDLPRGLVDGAPDSEAVGMQARNGGCAEHGKGEPDAEPDDQCARQPVVR